MLAPSKSYEVLTILRNSGTAVFDSTIVKRFSKGGNDRELSIELQSADEYKAQVEVSIYDSNNELQGTITLDIDTTTSNG